MYCEYWNLNKAPFDNVPDPSMYVDSHVSMENVISETIFAIKEGNECFAVIIGDVGLGKTLSLRIIIDSLEINKYKIVLITNPSISFVQLLKEIIGQITGKQCEENRKSELLEIFNHLLFETADRGQKIVIFIDEANVISPANLENLRLLTNMQDDQRNLFTLVLAGQLELARRLEHPKRANLYQRIGTYGRIDKLPSEEALKSYIETRLKLAGAQNKIFADDTMPIIWENSDQGIPRLINKICKLCLKAGETNYLETISAGVAAQIAERFQKLSKTALQKRKPRSFPDISFSEEEAHIDGAKYEKSEDTVVVEMLPEEIVHQVIMDDTISFPAKNEKPEDFVETSSLSEEIIQSTVPEEVAPLAQEKEETEDTVTVKSLLEETTLTESIDTGLVSAPEPIEEIKHDIPDENKKPLNAEQEIYEEVLINKHKIILKIPGVILERGKLSNLDAKSKVAGYWAAQIVKENPFLTNSPLVDPVSIWHEIKNVVLMKMNNPNTDSTMEIR